MTASETKAASAARLKCKRRAAWRRIAWALVAGLSCALSACGVQCASSDPTFPGDADTRHPIVLASGPTTLDVYPVRGALEPRTRADIRAFAERYRRFGAGEIAILAPGRRRSEASAVREIRGALVAAGVRGAVRVGSYEDARPDGAPPIRVEFVGLKAEVPTRCGLWPEDLASGSSTWGWKNEPYANFGCANQSVLAAQVDDPRDFVEARAPGPPDVAMRTRAIKCVRKGEDPGTGWRTRLTPIGGEAVSGGGGSSGGEDAPVLCQSD